MVEVSAYTYDADGNVLTATSYADATHSYTTTYQYDWRDRLVTTLVDGGSGSTHVYTFTKNTYDNFGRVVETDDYSDADGDLSTTGDQTLLAKSTTAYDNLGQVYQTNTYLVDNGTAGSPQTTNYWHDAAGNEIALMDPVENDSLGNMTASVALKRKPTRFGSVYYYYDGAGEVTKKIDRDGRATISTTTASAARSKKTGTIRSIPTAIRSATQPKR